VCERASVRVCMRTPWPSAPYMMLFMVQQRHGSLMWPSLVPSPSNIWVGARRERWPASAKSGHLGLLRGLRTWKSGRQQQMGPPAVNDLWYWAMTSARSSCEDSQKARRRANRKGTRRGRAVRGGGPGRRGGRR
jgi:hypothetical protein